MIEGANLIQKPYEMYENNSSCVPTTLLQIAPSARDAEVLDFFGIAATARMRNHVINVPSVLTASGKLPALSAQAALPTAQLMNLPDLVTRKILLTPKNSDGPVLIGVPIFGKITVAVAKARYEAGRRFLIVGFSRIASCVPHIDEAPTTHVTPHFQVVPRLAISPTAK